MLLQRELHFVNVLIPEERSAEPWPHTGQWGGEGGTGRRSRTVQWGGLLVPSTGCNSALENRHRLCATSPETGENGKKRKYVCVHSNTLFTIHFFVLCVHYTIHMGTSNNTVPWCKTSIEGEPTKLQRKLCLLVAKVTGINDCELTGRIMFWSALAFGESHDPTPVVLY